MKNENKKIGVFFGGRNAEHDISIITGEFALATLKKKMSADVVGIYVSRDGKFYIDEKISELNFFQGDFEDKLKKMKSASIQWAKNSLIFKEDGLMGKKIEIDFAFPTFHGQFGEDGSVQGFFEFLNIAYAGCGVYTSSVAIDKLLTKKFFEANSMPSTKYLGFLKADFKNNKENVLEKIKNELEFPVFVKPTKQGSSIGISKVDSFEELENALDLGFYYDNEVVVENGVKNIKDLTCAVLSNGEEVITSEVQESVLEDGEFLDYQKKYMEDGGTQIGGSEKIKIPADINDDIKKKVQEFSKAVFEKLQGNGIIRVDFLLDQETGELYLNEINTLPGTLYHHLWQKSGKDITDVIGWMIKDGEKRYEEVKNRAIDFKSDVLNSANSMKLKN